MTVYKIYPAKRVLIWARAKLESVHEIYWQDISNIRVFMGKGDPIESFRIPSTLLEVQ